MILNGIFKNNPLDFDVQHSDNFSIRTLEHGTKIFKHIAEIYYENSVLGLVSFIPYDGSVLDSGFCQIQIKNEWLYEPSNHLREVLRVFLMEFQIDFTGWNRLDICIDSPLDENYGVFTSPTETGNKSLLDLSYLLTNEVVQITGKEKNFTSYTTTKNKITGWLLGKRTGSRLLRFYNKSEEMRSKVNKPWIGTFWSGRCGFTDLTNKDIYRLEMQFNREYLTEIVGFEDVFNHNYLLQMMITGMYRFFDLRTNTGKSRVTNEKEVMLINWYKVEYFITHSAIDESEGFNAPIRKHSTYYNSVLQNKILLKKMFFRYCFEYQESLASLTIMNEIMKITECFDYNHFVHSKIEFWAKEIDKLPFETGIFDVKQFRNDLQLIRDIAV